MVNGPLTWTVAKLCFIFYFLLWWCQSVCLYQRLTKNFFSRTAICTPINSLSFSLWRIFCRTPISQISNPLNMSSCSFTPNKTSHEELPSDAVCGVHQVLVSSSKGKKNWKIMKANCSVTLLNHFDVENRILQKVNTKIKYAQCRLEVQVSRLSA